MMSWNALTASLARDVSIWGELKSPLLSWLGAAGLLLFFGWQIIRLYMDAARSAEPFVDVEPLLTSFAEQVEASDLRHSYDRAFAERGEVTRGREADIDRLSRLDTAMREIDTFRRPWIQFRKSLLIERVHWFKEPRIFSTRRAEEFFSQDEVLLPSIDLGFYGQLPSLITGLGLLLTFVAICIGLSRLHADGPTITGIQGLINGLAGKFLTSIVALLCANAFILLERPAVRRLHRLHAEFLTLLDESFPRRTVEDLLDALGRHQTTPTPTTADHPSEHADATTHESQERLGASIDELASAVRVLTEWMREPQAARDAVSAGRERELRAIVPNRERRVG